MQRKALTVKKANKPASPCVIHFVD
jgi:hypothetical protein